MKFSAGPWQPVTFISNAPSVLGQIVPSPARHGKRRDKRSSVLETDRFKLYPRAAVKGLSHISLYIVFVKSTFGWTLKDVLKTETDVHLILN